VTYAIELQDVTKIYRIRESTPQEDRKYKFAQFVLGQSFTGKIEIKEKVVVDKLSLRVREGETVGLLGPNGAGKSTLLEMIATGILPDSGSIRLMGQDVISHRHMVRELITPIFPMFGSNAMWTARQNLEYHALLYNIPKREMIKRIGQVLSLVGLEERADDIVRKYSTGMMVRLTLAKGLMVDNPIYLMDEPFLGIDPGTAKEIRQFVKEELGKRGRTILLATHILQDVEELCDRVVLMNEGRLVAEGTPEELKKGIKGVERIEAEIQIQTANAGNLVQRIQELPDVEDLAWSRLASETVEGIRLTLHTHDSRVVLPILIETLQEEHGKTRHIRIIEPTLEDVFIHYTGKQLAGPAAPGKPGRMIGC